MVRGRKPCARATGPHGGLRPRTRLEVGALGWHARVRRRPSGPQLGCSLAFRREGAALSLIHISEPTRLALI
eukprot:3574930-Alexandrium_andersonii.AAC.1